MVLLFKRLFNNSTGNSKGQSRQFKLAANDVNTIDTPITTMKYLVASCQSAGRERSHNEDTLFVLNCNLGGLESPVDFGIFLVADGMGGHQSGELASNLAAQGISRYLLDHVFHEYMFEQKSFAQDELSACVVDAVAAAQALVVERVPGGGTTLTFVMAVGDELYSAHVGDSRLYLLTADGTLTQKTRDHSLVKRLVDLGEITADEAGFHPQRNVLYRALGQTDPFQPDTEVFSINTGERLLICSDGLWGVIDEPKLLQINDQADDLDQLAANLVQAANEAGGPDNISVIVVERSG